MKKRWETNELSAVSTISYGYTESATIEPIGPRFLRITDIQDDHVDWDSVPYCKIESADLPKYRLASGDIVFARTGATTGKSFLVADPPEAVFASYLIRLRLLDEKLLPAFVSLFFQSAGYWKSIKEGSAGSAQGGFNATKLGALSIPIPPLPEQQRIVDELEEAFASVATVQANAAKNLQNARALFESHLQSVFTERGKGWVETTIGDAFDTATGTTPHKGNSQYYGNFMPFVKPPELCDAFLDSAADNLSKAGAEVARTLPPRSILVSCIGNLGKIGLNVVPVAFNQQINAILPDEHKAIPELMFYQALCGSFKAQLEAKAGGTTVPIVNKSKFNRVTIALPPMPQQKTIVANLDGLRAETQRLESLYQQKVAALAALKKSLLYRAFSGQL